MHGPEAIYREVEISMATKDVEGNVMMAWIRGHEHGEAAVATWLRGMVVVRLEGGMVSKPSATSSPHNTRRERELG